MEYRYFSESFDEKEELDSFLVTIGKEGWDLYHIEYIGKQYPGVITAVNYNGVWVINALGKKTLQIIFEK